MNRKILVIGLFCVVYGVGAYADDCVKQLWIGATDGTAQESDATDEKSEMGIERTEVFSAIKSLCAATTRDGGQESAKNIQTLADRGSAPAQYALGMAYLLGKGVPKNAIKAGELFRAASYQGQARAVAAQVAIEKFGINVAPERWAEFQAVGMDAAAGKPAAQLQLAIWLDWNIGDTNRRQEAMRWYRAAALQGLVPAQRGLGLLLLTRDVDEGVKWLTQAGNSGDILAQNALGMHFRFGLTENPKYELALYWFRLAASKANKNSILRLGDMFRRGEGVRENLVLAYALYFFTSDRPVELESQLSQYEPPIGDSMSGPDIEKARNLIREMNKPGHFVSAFDRESRGSEH